MSRLPLTPDQADLSARIYQSLRQAADADLRSLADATIRIPVASRAESLNLSAAATVCLFEAVRQRRGRGGSFAS